MTDSKPLTEDEIKLYDRQIRLWGVKAQGDVRNSHILVINLTSVGVEVCKNLVLGGIGSLTIVDGSKVIDQDLNVNFFLDETQVGQFKLEACKSRIRDLNPRVELDTETRDWTSIVNLEEFITRFSLVVATGVCESEIVRLNGLTRRLGIPFYCSGTHGLYGYIFADLIAHQSNVKYDSQSSKKVGPIDPVSSITSVKEIKENDTQTQCCTIRNEFRPFDQLSGKFLKQKYPSTKKQIKKICTLLPAILALLKLPSYLNKLTEDVDVSANELQKQTLKVLSQLKLPQEIALKNPETITNLARQAYCEYQPVSSILGGALSQDIINYIVKNELPINNITVLDGYSDEMPVYTL
ncbi:hypothetical protein FOA43_002480 [Brettanomyces nanus]|uniref:Ubiquitin-like 1-activating enzyme E1A n=1 Tax=Eeniella nana TaxID=13502 RepID=A0A875S175_EENNA|nr:uncharacterized protein FOA43_002480 [Brettanomyces nanus]QPG75136.1 hypothetical protein FOA43_002480 [Brettanomyces nanus]